MAADCDPDGISTIQYEVSGLVEYGPYTGPYTESGTIVIGPQDHASSFPITNMTPKSGYITDYEAHFTIDAPQGQILGTKTFYANGDGVPQQAACQEFVDRFIPARGGGLFDWIVLLHGTPRYTILRSS